MSAAPVKNRISKCGMLIMPAIEPIAKEIEEYQPRCCAPNSNSDRLTSRVVAAFVYNAPKLPALAMHSAESNTTAPTSSPALMICTQVAASMPPKAT
jgi:hypothetical protein